MKCPNCGEDNCHFMTSSKTSTKGFSMGDACCGMLILGPMGILCGLCGIESETKTKEFWVCDSCGSQFSQSEVRKFMEEENNRLKKLLFYREVQAQTVIDTYTNTFGELVKKAEEEYLQNLNKERKIIHSNPPFENQKFELVKTKCSHILTEKDLVYLVILEENGIIVADKGLIFADILLSSVNHICCYKNCIYVGAICIRTENASDALSIYKFLDRLYNYGKKQIPEHYESYKELLKELQKNSDVDTKRLEHFSSQPEYEEYINQIFAKGMQHFLSLNPEDYSEYKKRESKFEIWDKRTTKYIWGCLGISIIIGLLTGIFSGIILFVILIIILEVINFRKRRYLEEKLPEYLLEIYKEQR